MAMSCTLIVSLSIQAYCSRRTRGSAIVNLRLNLLCEYVDSRFFYSLR